MPMVPEAYPGKAGTKTADLKRLEALQQIWNNCYNAGLKGVGSVWGLLMIRSDARRSTGQGKADGGDAVFCR